MKITLCGSTKFRTEYEEMNKVLSKRGHVVYSVSCFMHSGDTLTDEEKITLDLVHLKKILYSDFIFVIDKDEYVGESTRKEIQWAELNEKGILYYSAYIKPDYFNVNGI